MRFLFLIAFLLLATPAFAHDEALPLGDGKISAAPQIGYIFSCQQNFSNSFPGAQVVGRWIKGNVWYPDEKLHVQGYVAWPNSSISITEENGFRIIRANNLPKHPTGVYPVSPNDPAYQVDRNPNSISEQQILLKLPLSPSASNPSCVPMGIIGFALTGTAIFNGLDAGGRDAAAHEVLDKCDGHPQPQGQYHYHSYSHCLNDKASEAGGHSDLVGYALDGYGIYGLKGEDGKELHSADLDACHGHTHTVMWNGQPQKFYHYHMTADYPYTLGCYHGTPTSGGQAAMPNRDPHGQGPDDRPRGGDRGNGQGRGDPRQIMQSAAAILKVDPETLRAAVGPPPPPISPKPPRPSTCRKPPFVLRLILHGASSVDYVIKTPSVLAKLPVFA